MDRWTKIRPWRPDADDSAMFKFVDDGFAYPTSQTVLKRYYNLSVVKMVLAISLTPLRIIYIVILFQFHAFSEEP